MLQKADQLAEREDPDIAAVLQVALESDGCEVRLNADVRSIEPTATGVRTHLAHDFVEGTHLFLATGRQPNTDDLGLETVGVKPDRVGHIEVDGHLRSGVDRLWVVGDIRGGPAFTHTVYDDFRVMHSQFLGDGSRTRGRIVPYAMFTEPELGPIGLK